MAARGAVLAGLLAIVTCCAALPTPGVGYVNVVSIGCALPPHPEVSIFPLHKMAAISGGESLPCKTHPCALESHSSAHSVKTSMVRPVSHRSAGLSCVVQEKGFAFLSQVE